MNLNSILNLAKMAPSIQQNPGYDASNADVEFLFRICMEICEKNYKNSTTVKDALIFMILGEIEGSAKRRKDGFFSRQDYREGISLNEALLNFITYFVEEVWIKFLKALPSKSSDRKSYYALYSAAVKYAWTEEKVKADKKKEIREQLNTQTNTEGK